MREEERKRERPLKKVTDVDGLMLCCLAFWITTKIKNKNTGQHKYMNKDKLNLNVIVGCKRRDLNNHAMQCYCD